jgi:predicted transcriptional regulator
MSNNLNRLAEKIQKRRKKLIKACLAHDIVKQAKHKRKLIQLWLQYKS